MTASRVVGDVLRTGWKLKGRVLRPAMVKVVRPSVDELNPVGVSRSTGAASWHPSASGSRRTTTPCSACPRTRPTRRSRAPTRSSRSSSTPTPTRATRTAEERFKEVSAAYDVLGDTEKRNEYDEVRRMVASGVGPGGPGRSRRARRFGRRLHVRLRRRRRWRRLRRHARQPVRPRRRGGGRAPRRGRTAARARPRDRAAPDVRRRRARRHEHGALPRRRRVLRRATASGAAPGTLPETCPQCHGSGRDRGRPGPVLVLAGVPQRAAGAARSSTTRARRATAAASRCAPAR